jgi:hypothetical protein
MDDNKTDEGAAEAETQEVKFKYIKSNFFRVIHADGAWGGVSPRGNIHLSFYNERAALPDSSKIVLSVDGELKEPEQFHASSRIVREIECDVVFDLETAKALQGWLNHKVQVLEEIIAKAGEKQEEVAKNNDEKMAH